MLEQFRDFLSHATPSQRSVLAICISISFLLAFLMALGVGVVIPSLNDLLVPAVMEGGLFCLVTVIVVFAGMLCWLWPQRFSPRPMPRVYSAITLLATFGFTTTALLGGNFTYPTNIVIIGLVPCGLLLLDTRSTAQGLALGILMLSLNDLAIFTGLVRYAPAYGPQAFVGDHHNFLAELLRSGIQYVSISAYCVLIWLLFSHFDRRQNALKHLSQIDMLTGLANRRYFMERLEIECCRLGRNQHRFCLVMIDADHFKKINDTHGHLVGDEVLKAIAHTLTQHMRVPADLAARIGGEEFALLLPDTGLAGAQAVCERIRAGLERLRFQGPVRTFNVTLSMGVVENEDHDAETLLHYADANLYLAKARGRNRVVTSGYQQEAVHEFADTLA